MLVLFFVGVCIGVCCSLAIEFVFHMFVLVCVCLLFVCLVASVFSLCVCYAVVVFVWLCV